MGKWMDGRIDGIIDEKMDGRIGGWMDEMMNE